MSYDQFLAVMLTALGVILAALALVVGLVAIFGYQKISEIAAEEAPKGAVSYLEQYLGGSGRPRRRALSASKKKLAGDVRKMMLAPGSTDQAPGNSADEKKVAQRYPKKEKDDDLRS